MKKIGAFLILAPTVISFILLIQSYQINQGYFYGEIFIGRTIRWVAFLYFLFSTGKLFLKYNKNEIEKEEKNLDKPKEWV